MRDKEGLKALVVWLSCSVLLPIVFAVLYEYSPTTVQWIETIALCIFAPIIVWGYGAVMLLVFIGLWRGVKVVVKAIDKRIG